MIVADSDVLIDFLRGRGEGARPVARELETGALATTAVTAFEIRSGVRAARQRAAVDVLFRAMTLFPFGAEEAVIAADLRRRLEGQGQAIGMADYLIAATCIAHKAALLTRNRKHFERVVGLQLASMS